jgi:hypothetical protein
MEKGTLPKNRKRWIDFLPDEVYNSLKQTDKDNLLHFQRLSKSRVQKELKLKKLKEEIKELRKSISETNMKEEYYYLKVQFLHNVFGCRVDVVRGLRKPNSLKQVPSNKISYKRKTHNGKPLKPYYVWNGKVYSSSLEKPKSIYFQSEDKLKETISKLTGNDIKTITPDFIKKYLKKEYTDYVRDLMRKNGVEKFSSLSISFEKFVKWSENKNKKQITSNTIQPTSNQNDSKKRFKDHIKQITWIKDKDYYKSLTPEERKSFSPWLILKYLSFCYELLPILGEYTHRMSELGPEQVYKVLIGIIPKGEYKFKVLNRKKKKGVVYSDEMIELLSKEYECSSETSKEYIEILFEIGEYEKTREHLFRKYGKELK